MGKVFTCWLMSKMAMSFLVVRSLKASSRATGVVSKEEKGYKIVLPRVKSY